MTMADDLTANDASDMAFDAELTGRRIPNQEVALHEKDSAVLDTSVWNFVPATNGGWDVLNSDGRFEKLEVKYNTFGWEPYMKHVVVEDYKPAWAKKFEELKMELANHLQSAEIPFISIEHVGSTSVPGLAAKCNIDIDVIVEREHVNEANWTLCFRGNYECLGLMGIPDRLSLRKRYSILTQRFIKHNLYICVKDSLVVRNHFTVREVLRTNTALREEYGRIKKDLAAAGMIILDYCAAKNDILDKIRKAGGMSEKDRVAITTYNSATGATESL